MNMRGWGDAAAIVSILAVMWLATYGLVALVTDAACLTEMAK